MNKKPELSADLVAVKGAASPAPDMPARASAPSIAAESSANPGREKGEHLVPLNFRIPASFRRAFKTYAAEHDLKLNELLRRCFEGYRQQQGD
jgi:hypothetical protein